MFLTFYFHAVCVSRSVCQKKGKPRCILELLNFSIIFRVFGRPAGHDITILVDRCKKRRKFLVRPNLEKKTVRDQRLAGALKLEIQGS